MRKLGLFSMLSALCLCMAPMAVSAGTSEEWQFGDVTPWTVNEDGSMTHNLFSTGATLKSKLDLTKDVTIFFRVNFELETATEQLQNVCMRIYSSKGNFNLAVSGTPKTSTNNWLCEPAFMLKNKWVTCPVPRYWSPSDNQGMTVKIQYSPNEKAFWLHLAGEKAEWCSGNMYLTDREEDMANFFSATDATLEIFTNLAATTVFTVSDMTVINGGKLLTADGDLKKAQLPAYPAETQFLTQQIVGVPITQTTDNTMSTAAVAVIAGGAAFAVSAGVGVAIVQKKKKKATEQPDEPAEATDTV